jgi:hypothetical protein
LELIPLVVALAMCVTLFWLVTRMSAVHQRSLQR